MSGRGRGLWCSSFYEFSGRWVITLKLKFSVTWFFFFCSVCDWCPKLWPLAMQHLVKVKEIQKTLKSVMSEMVWFFFLISQIKCALLFWWLLFCVDCIIQTDFKELSHIISNKVFFTLAHGRVQVMVHLEGLGCSDKLKFVLTYLRSIQYYSLLT